MAETVKEICRFELKIFKCKYVRNVEETFVFFSNGTSELSIESHSF